MISLLPPSGSPQEQALADAIDYGINPRVIRGFKFAPTDSVLPWLIWEYGLGEILAWVPDPRQAIQDGVRFQRIRGTPASLRMALKWMNIENIYIEEEPPGKHFAEFQVGIHDVPNDFFVDNVVALAKLSAPARSRLMRMYNDRYDIDIRRFMLDQSDWGSLLSDYSGVRLTPDGPVLSFGRFNPFEATFSQAILKFAANRQHHNNALSDDLYRLDFAILNETDPHTRNHNAIYVRDQIWQNPDPLSPFTPDFEPPLHLAKALIVLSDSWRLGEINACFAVTTQTEVGATFILSQDQLSDHVWHFLYQEILERFYRAQENEATAIINEEIHTFVEKELHKNFQEGHIWPILSEETLDPIQLSSFAYSETFIATMYPGMLTWHQHRHLDRPWTNSDPIVNITLN